MCLVIWLLLCFNTYLSLNENMKEESKVTGMVATVILLLAYVLFVVIL